MTSAISHQSRDFPLDSILRAREIVDRLHKREGGRATKGALVDSLYSGLFFEPVYGFTDTLRHGRGGTYLHELESDVECFSKAGMDYLIAREAGLDPTLWSATSMRDYEPGENRDLCLVTNHSFITVPLGKDTYVVDSNHSLKGRVVKMHGDRWEIEKIDYLSKKVTRSFTSLSRLSEDEYLEEMEDLRKPGFGRNILEGGQRIESAKATTFVQFLPDSEELASFRFSQTGTRMYDHEGTFNLRLSYLKAPVSDDGTWHFRDGVFGSFYARSKGWALEEFGDPVLTMEHPFSEVDEYVGLMQKIHQAHGRKMPFWDISSNIDLIYHFASRGVDELGRPLEESKLDGPDLRRLEDLVGIMADRIDTRFAVNPQLRDVDIRARYFVESRKRRSAENPYGILESEERLEELAEELFEGIERNLVSKIDTAIISRRVVGGYDVGKSRESARLELQRAFNSSSRSDAFYDILPLRVKDRALFYKVLDEALFLQAAFESGEDMNITEDEFRDFMLCSNHSRILNSAFHIRKSLPLRGLRTGLKRSLAISKK